MTRIDCKLRVIMLAPTREVGGISTWFRVLRKYSDQDLVTYRDIDTSKMRNPRGQLVRVALRAMWDATKRLISLLGWVVRFRPDVVYFTSSPTIGLIVRDCPYIVILKMLGVPTLMHLHGGDVEGFFGRGRLRRFLVRNSLRLCRKILVITRPVEQAAREIFGPDKVRYFPNMLDDDIVRAAGQQVRGIRTEAPFKLLHVGWQVPTKGNMELLRAVPHVEHPVECDFVGGISNEHRSRMEREATELGVPEKIHLRGPKHGDELVEAFQQADVFVFPTYMEGFPNVILEAMAYGLPAIANDVGNIREMIAANSDRPAGVLLEKTNPPDPEEVADKINKLIADQALRRQLSENGRERIKTYLASTVVRQLEELLCSLFLNEPGKTG